VDNGESKYWFPPKRYGWGWGLPSTWQGWVVFLGFIVLISGGAVVVPPNEHLAGFVGYCGALCAVLVGICYAKGEPPRWRWGK
jgi:hypothetical protein